MKTKLLFALVLSSTAAFAAPPKVTSWANPACATGECEIKGIKIYLEKMVMAGMMGNNMGAEIEASSKEVLKKYAFVQYIKGCVFQENSKGERKIVRRELFGKQGQLFKHLDWEIDSASDVDPIYWSKPGAGYDELREMFIPRNAAYMTLNPVTNEGGGSWAGKLSNLTAPKIYVQDVPSVSSYTVNPDMTWVSQNSSLEFKICLHDIKDIPEKAETLRDVVPNPIHCMNWSSNFVYEAKKFRIVEQKAIHPYCLEQ